MTMVKMPTVSPEKIPADVGKRFFCATLEAIRRTQTEFPEIWGRIEARASELQAKGTQRN